MNFFLITIIILIGAGNSGSCREIIVGNGGEFQSLKQAILASGNNDRVLLQKGYYKENTIVIEKPIDISGIGYPVIDLEFGSPGFIIKSDSVTISGLEIKNISVNYLNDLSAIKIENSKNCIIENNLINNTFFGIYLANSEDCIVKKNKIKGNAVSESSSGNGIHLWKCNDIIIEDNEVNGHRDGVYFEFVKNTKVINNFSHNNLRYGLHFMFSDSNSYQKNLFSKNGAGVAVMYTKNILMTENRFEDNWGPASYGILLKDISRSIIKKNFFFKNTTGIYMEGSDNLLLKENEFRSNGWAIKILGNCIYDTLIKNNFIDNTFDISSNSVRNENYYNENYWDKYGGYDINKDGIGDVPYRPVSIYSIMIEKIPESSILLRSFIMEVLDLTEKVIPVFIPETLSDFNPKITLNEHVEN